MQSQCLESALLVKEIVFNLRVLDVCVRKKDSPCFQLIK